jgi:universal stress protein E
MKPFARIIVDLDAAAAAHPALDRAADLARVCGARLMLVDVVTVPDAARRYLPAGAEDLVVNTRRSRLEQLAASVTDLETAVEVLKGRPAQALIAEAAAGDYDLVVRSHARDLAATPRLLGSVDMQLFRHCPATVWAVGPQASNPPRTVVAAVHADRTDAAGDALNVRILETAHLMAQASGGRLIVLQAWHPFAEDTLKSRYSAADFTAYVTAAGETARQDLDALLETSRGITREARVELLRGAAEDVLPAYTVANGVDLVVMGTMARSGLSGLIMGNTAERLLQRLPCSVMAVKPEGFRPLSAS